MTMQGEWVGVRLADLRMVSQTRPAGYLQAVCMAAIVTTDDVLHFDQESWNRVRKAYEARRLATSPDHADYAAVVKAISTAPDAGLWILLKETLASHERAMELHRDMSACWKKRQKQRICTYYAEVLRKSATGTTSGATSAVN
jgi:hypothetical protein